MQAVDLHHLSQKGLAMTTSTPPARKNQKLLKSKMNFGREDLAELRDTRLRFRGVLKGQSPRM